LTANSQALLNQLEQILEMNTQNVNNNYFESFVCSPIHFDGCVKHETFLEGSGGHSPGFIGSPFTNCFNGPTQCDSGFDHVFAKLLDDNTNTYEEFTNGSTSTSLLNSTTILSPSHLFDLNTLFAPVPTVGIAQPPPLPQPTVLRINPLRNFEIQASKAAPTLLAPPSVQNVKAKRDLKKQPIPGPVCMPVQNFERAWRTVYTDPQYANTIEVQITSKTRCEEPSYEVPEKMYSSLKYEIRQTATGSLISDIPFLLGRITVVDASNLQEIVKDKRTVLKGTVETALTKPTANTKSKRMDTSADDEFRGVMKVQHTDCSYHHKKSDFCWQISYFVPSDLERPVLIKRSAAYKVYARKPNQGKKRKRADPKEEEEEEEEPTSPVATLQTVTDAIGSFDDFSSRLDELVQCSKKLKPNEKRNALELVSTKLLQLDPLFFCEQLKKLQDKKN
jgi:hypothetical protein